MHFYYQAPNTVLQRHKKNVLSSLKATINLLSLKTGGTQGIHFIILAFLTMTSNI